MTPFAPLAAVPVSLSAPPSAVRIAGDAAADVAILRPAPQPRSAFRRFSSISTRWMDNDAYGHINNVVYYSRSLNRCTLFDFVGVTNPISPF